MIKFIIIIKIFIILILFPHVASSLTPTSALLITNAAISSNDYETAAKYFLDENYSDLNIIEQKKKLISLVNTNKLNQASKVANQIIKFGINDQEAWIVYLINAKLNGQLKVFSEFESLDNRLNIRDEFEIIYYIFYKNKELEKNNYTIAEALLDIVQGSVKSSLDQKENINYILFYLSLVLELNPKFNEAIFLQAQFFQHLKNYDKAETIYNAIQLDHPLYLEAQKNIVLNKKNAGEFYKAEKLLNDLLYRNPDNFSLIVLLADLYRANKIYNKAIKYYTKLFEISNIDNEQFWRIFYMRGICYERLNKWEKAEKDFLKALELESEQPQVLNYLAYGWIERNIMIDKSLEMLELAIKKNPKSHYILDSLAWGYFKKNDLLRAVKIMEEVIQIAPAEAISLDHLGDIYFELGRRREAYFMWTQARDLAEPEDNIIENVQIKIDRFNAG